MKKYKHLSSAVGIFLLGQTYTNVMASENDFEGTKKFKKFVKSLDKTNPIPELSTESKMTAWLLYNSPAEIIHFIVESMGREGQAKLRLAGKEGKKFVDQIWSHESVTITGGVTHYNYETDGCRKKPTNLISKILYKFPFNKTSSLGLEIENKVNPCTTTVEAAKRKQGLSEIISAIEKMPFKRMKLNFKIWSKEDAESLEKLENVQYLDLSENFNFKNPINPYTIKSISKMPQLIALNLSENFSAVSYRDDISLEALKNLENLEILYSRLENDHIDKLNIAHLTNLKTLDLRGNDITSEKIQELQKFLKNTQIHFDNFYPEIIPSSYDDNEYGEMPD